MRMIPPMDPGTGRGKGRASALTAVLTTAIMLALTGTALAVGGAPTGASGPPITCTGSICVSGPEGTTGPATGPTGPAGGPTGPTGPTTHPQPAPTVTCRVTAPTCSSDKILSNETTSTTWAYDDVPSAIRQYPSNSSARVATLHANTEDDLPEVYIVLRERQVAGVSWVLIRVPMRPNGRTGWVTLSSLSDLNVVTTELVIDKAARQLRLYKAGHLIFTAPVGIGTPDDPTPTGHFWIREEFPVRGDPAYGPFAFGTSDYSTTLTDWPGGGVIGVHGTDQPGLIPGNPSHGCVRLRNADISRLSHLVPVGTPLLIE
jgi:L,D-transpeptidase-like protein